MKKTILIFAVLSILIIVTSLVLSYGVIKYSNNPLPFVSDSNPVYLEPDLPAIVSLSDLNAILVLDVSGSMKNNDPDHLQTEAVIRFFDVYSKLAREVVEKGATARVAVVLFSSIAQTVNWGSETESALWLDATYENQQLFEKTIKNFLGQRGQPEPRNGQETDYLAAMYAVENLFRNLNSPPAVVFMTDGDFQPNGYLTPSSRKKIPTADWDIPVNAIKRGEFSYLNVSGPGPKQILNRRNIVVDGKTFSIPLSDLNKSDLAVYSTELKEKLNGLLKYPFDDPSDSKAGVLWTPVFLNVNHNNTTGLADTIGPDNSDGRLLTPDKAEKLVGDFVNILANWLKLYRLDIDQVNKKFQIPTNTETFAVSLLTSTEVASLEIVKGGRKHSLSGKEKVWAAVLTDNGESQNSLDGLWDIRSDSGIESGSVYIKPRYEWVLHLPRRITGTGSVVAEGIPIEVYLYSLVDNKPVDVAGVYKSLPANLPYKAVFPDGREIEGILSLLDDKNNEKFVVYNAKIDVSSEESGTVQITLDLRPISRIGILVLHDDLVASLDIRPYLRPIVKNFKGEPSSLNIRNFPASQGKWQERLGIGK